MRKTIDDLKFMATLALVVLVGQGLMLLLH